MFEATYMNGNQTKLQHLLHTINPCGVYQFPGGVPGHSVTGHGSQAG